MCASEVSDIEHSLWQEYQDDGLEVWGIASQEPADTVERYVDNLGLTFPILLDEDGSLIETYRQVAAFPSTAYPQDWLVGTDGIIIYVNNSFELDAIVSAVENELNGG